MASIVRIPIQSTSSSWGTRAAIVHVKISTPRGKVLVKRHLFSIILVVLTGCDILARDCESVLVFGIGITLQDSITGGPALADEIIVIARDGEYVETEVVHANRQDPGRISIVEDRPGSYQITVTATGYSPWTKDVEVRSTDDGCHVRPVLLLGLLQRQGTS
jgi:hypothetical protein